MPGTDPSRPVPLMASYLKPHYLHLTDLCVYLFMEVTDVESVIGTHPGIQETEVT